MSKLHIGRRPQLLVAVATFLLLVTPAIPTWAAGPSPTFQPTFKPAPCPRLTSGRAAITFDERAGKQVECGYVTVLEDRAKPRGKTIQLPIVWFKTPGKAANEAVIYLAGGPGGAGLWAWQALEQPGYADWFKGRDFIVFDQRGTGVSKPSLACPELADAWLEGMKRAGAERRAISDDAMTACRTRLLGQGINLAAYTTPASADDVEDIRTALGVGKLDLWGTSYGTRLALEVMRRHPQNVRSAILDSLLPAQADPYQTNFEHLDRTLRSFFDACTEDVDCARDYPNLEADFYEALDALDAAPVELKAIGAGGRAVTMKVSGSDLVAALWWGMYDPAMYAKLPQMIRDALGGDYRQVAALLVRWLTMMQSSAHGMSRSVSCADFASNASAEAMRADAKAHPRLAELARRDGEAPDAQLTECQAWGAAKLGAAIDDPVVSDIPTLLINNRYDPSTPPWWAEAAAKTLRKATLVITPMAGHGPLMSGEPCLINMAARFLDDPGTSLDMSCMKQLKPPTFELPK